MSRGRVACALILLVAALAVPRGTGAQEVREYVGAFSPQGLEGGTTPVNQARFVASTSGLGADLLIRLSFPPPDPSAPSSDNPFDDIELWPNGVCSEVAVDTLTAPAPIDTTTSDPQQVEADVEIRVGLAPMPCASAPSTLETETASARLVVTLTDESVDGRLVLPSGFELALRAPRSGSTTSPPTTDIVEPTSPRDIGLGELLAGSPVLRETGTALERRSGCDGDTAPDDLSAACREAAAIANDFSLSIEGLVTPEIQRDLATAVLVGSLRGGGGDLLVPSVGHLLPVILQLAAQANAGDEDALVAFRRLIGALVTIDLGALS